MSQIAFPFRFDSRGRTAMADDKQHIRDMLQQLIFTNPGERVNRPDFGSGINQLLFAPNSPELAATLQFTLQAAIGRWLGDLIEMRDLAVSANDAQLSIELSYLIRASGEVEHASFSQQF
ncbi:MAG: GPW/gp25 family protein [Burkholderiales bacterium]|nr:GPW/gp25 family protein [Burkholderiales bacterium]